MEEKQQEEAAAASPDELFEFAVTAAGRALRAGRPSEAAIYMRVAEAARRVAGADEAEPGPELPVERPSPPFDTEALRRNLTRRIEDILQREREADARAERAKGRGARQTGRAGR